jgi:hypothetical protein
MLRTINSLLNFWEDTVAKHLALVVVLLLAATAAKADNIVTVSLNPVDFGDQTSRDTGENLGDEIIAATFTWDTTTQTISNIVLAVSGPLQPLPFNNNSSNPNPYGPWFWVDGGLEFLSFDLTHGAFYSLNYGLHIPQGLPSTPGTYFADLNLFCAACLQGDQDAINPTATVTAVPDPVAAPEPGTALLLLTGSIGLCVIFLVARLTKPQKYACARIPRLANI